MAGAPSGTAPSSNGGALSAIDRFVSYIENAFTFIAAIFIFIMMFFLTAEVVGRKVFNAPIPGAIDWVEVWMGTFAFLGAAYCQRLGGHVRMEMIVGKLKGSTLWWTECFAVVIAFIYVVIIAYQSFLHFERAYNIGDSTIDIQLLTWPSKLMVPLAMTLLAIRLALNIWGYIRLAANPDREPVAVPIAKDPADVAREEIEHGLGHEAHQPTDDNR
jgi:TRAP-type C4-dicarboxylate transport system permease small subunit